MNRASMVRQYQQDHPRRRAGSKARNLLLAAILSLMIGAFFGCGSTNVVEDAPQTSDLQVTEQAQQGQANLREDGSYDSRDEVALYLYTYGRLPDNYITKKEAKALGWSGGSVEQYAPGKCIGGDYYGNYEGNLPSGDYHECDIDTLGKSGRGAKRLVYTEDEIYYTQDHYETFVQLYDGNGEL